MSGLFNKAENIRYALLVSCHTMTMCVGFNYAAFYLMEDNISERNIGILVAAGCVAAIFLQQLAGRIMDAGIFGGRRILMIIAAVEALCGYLMPFIGEKILAGIVFGTLLCITLVMAPIINSFRSLYRQYGIEVDYGIARGLGSLCFSGISFLLGYLTVHMGREIVPVSYGILGTVIFLIALSMPELKAESALVSSKEGKKSSMKLMDYPGFLVMLIGLSLVMLFHNMLMTYFISVIERVGGDSSDMGVAIGIAAIVELPVLFLYTRVKGSRPSKYFLMTSGLVFLIKAVLFIFAGNILMIYAIQMLQCLAYGLMAASRVYYVGEVIGVEHEATGQAYMAATETIGLVLGSYLGGLLIQGAGVYAMIIAGAAVCFAGAACMVISAVRMR